MILFSRKIVVPNRVISGYLRIEGSGIAEICESSVPPAGALDCGSDILFPGFIDQHVHGWARGSFWLQGTEDALKWMSIDLARTGVTSYLPTTGADSLENTLPGLGAAKSYIKHQNTSAPIGAEVVGVHLEGPFINKAHKGMQKEEYCIAPDRAFFDQMWDACGQSARLMTMAPELEGGDEMIAYARSKGIQINIGHSDASFETIRDKKHLGLGGFTHTFSGMLGFHHRNLGCVGAAMYFDDLYCEFAKQTGMTVSFEAFAIMYRLKGPRRIIMTTDNVGMIHHKSPKYHYIRKCTFEPRGDKQLLIRHDDGREEIIDKGDYNSVCTVELSYLESIKNLVKNVNPSLPELAMMTSENSAQYLGIYHKKGSLECGKDADILLLDANLNLRRVWCRGKEIPLNE